jgi:hypothetical protein
MNVTANSGLGQSERAFLVRSIEVAPIGDRSPALDSSERKQILNESLFLAKSFHTPR